MWALKTKAFLFVISCSFPACEEMRDFPHKKNPADVIYYWMWSNICNQEIYLKPFPDLVKPLTWIYLYWTRTAELFQIWELVKLGRETVRTMNILLWGGHTYVRTATAMNICFMEDWCAAILKRGMEEYFYQREIHVYFVSVCLKESLQLNWCLLSKKRFEISG